MSKYTYTVINSKAITDNYTVKKEKISGVTVYMYIPKEEKEKEMKETNLQHYKEDFEKILTFNYNNPRGLIKLIREKFGCKIELKSGELPTTAILEWMLQPYERPILDDVEREYLSVVLRPFRKNIRSVYKSDFHLYNGKKYEYIVVMLNNGSWGFPKFYDGTMYKGMKTNKEYTLKELGL